MKITYTDRERNDQEDRCYQLEELTISQGSRENRGYQLYTGIAVLSGDVPERYFVKFTKLDGVRSQEVRLARLAFGSESRFQVRHPCIAYVEGCKECELIPQEGDSLRYSISPAELEKLLKGGNRMLCLFEELVEGEDLEDFYALDREPVPEPVMFSHMLQLMEGMCAYMNHDQTDRLIHRDIKPANIRVTTDGKRVKYIDFDWAHVSRSRKTACMTGPISGTLGYLDPRQADIRVRKSDPGMDIYSLAMVFLYMLLGEHYIEDIHQIGDYSYLNREDLLYKLRPADLKRGGNPVFTGKEYDRFLRILARMMAREDRRYEAPEPMLKDFKAFLLQYYGEKEYRERFRETCFLNRETFRSFQEQAGKKQADQLETNRKTRRKKLVCIKENASRKEAVKYIYALEENQVIELRDMEKEEQPVLLVYHLDDRCYGVFLCEDFEVLQSGRNEPTASEICLQSGENKFRVNQEWFTLII